MSVFGFKKPVIKQSPEFTARDTTIQIIEVDGVQTVVAVTSKPVRQYIAIPMSLIEKAVEHMTGLELQDASARRAAQNGQ